MRYLKLKLKGLVAEQIRGGALHIVVVGPQRPLRLIFSEAHVHEVSHVLLVASALSRGGPGKGKGRGRGRGCRHCCGHRLALEEATDQVREVGPLLAILHRLIHRTPRECKSKESE